MMSYVAANGQEITDEMIERWCGAYEQGGFPAGERTAGGVVMGRPRLSADQATTLTIEVPVGMKAALGRKAEKQGTTASAYVRGVLSNDILTVQSARWRRCGNTHSASRVFGLP